MGAGAPQVAETIGQWLRGTPLPRGARWFLGFVVPACVCLVTMWRVHPHTVDDAYISFRYARNFANGLGFVYNAGEHIEGYTNFLWTALLGVSIKMGADPVIASKLLGGTFGIATLLMVFLIADRLRPLTVVPCIANWLLASTTVFAGHSVFGLETSMFAFFVTAGALLMLREEDQPAPADAPLWKKVPWSGLVFAAAGLTRPEAPMYLGLMMLFLGGKALLPLKRFVPSYRDEPLIDLEEGRGSLLFVSLLVMLLSSAAYLGMPELSALTINAGYVIFALAAVICLAALPRALFSPRNLVRGALFVAPVAAHMLWRKSYYGQWLPNTVAAKTGNLGQQIVGGYGYLMKYIDHEGPVLYLALFGIAVGFVMRVRAALAIGTIVAFGWIYVIIVGGDWMPLFRFVMPTLPFVMLLVGLGARSIIEKQNRMANYGMLLLGLVIVGHRSHQINADRRGPIASEKHFWDMAAGGVARWFNEQSTERGRDDVYGTVALGDIGQVGYETDFPILDLLGLVDPVIAKLPGGYTTKIGKGFRDRFFDVKPRYFILISGENDCRHPTVIGSRVIWSDSRFRPQYAVSGRVRLDQGFFWCIYEHVSTHDPKRAPGIDPVRSRHLLPRPSDGAR